MAASVRDVTPESRSIDPYRSIVADDVQLLRQLAEPLEGLRVWHLNSAANGGGVAELLRSQVALEQGLGLKSRWLVIEPSIPDFFAATKKMHNALQGDALALTPKEWDVYHRESQAFAKELEQLLEKESADILINHDPQPLGAAILLPSAIPKVLRIHPDICSPSTSALKWLASMTKHFAGFIISRQDCAPVSLPAAKTSVIAPAIDPLSEKNRLLDRTFCQNILAKHGIAIDRPLITQVSRFDKWKDPLGVLAAYQAAKKEIPALQLALVGFMTAEDDPEAAAHFSHIKAAAGADPDVHLFISLEQLHDTPQDTFINAIQTASAIVLQKSTREGFGLTVTEGMWKGTPLIGGATGGILLQIEHEQTGLLVHDIPETTQAILRLLKDPAERKRLGEAGRDSVLKRFLLPHYLAQHLGVYTALRP